MVEAFNSPFITYEAKILPKDEWKLLEKGLNRVTDTCIPEEEAFRRLQQHIFEIWKEAEEKGER
ncbi:MAG: hypothetical protein AAFN93_24525, partial [Bacteroidota bacterium]